MQGVHRADQACMVDDPPRRHGVFSFSRGSRQQIAEAGLLAAGARPGNSMKSRELGLGMQAETGSSRRIFRDPPSHPCSDGCGWPADARLSARREDHSGCSLDLVSNDQQHRRAARPGDFRPAGAWTARPNEQKKRALLPPKSGWCGWPLRSVRDRRRLTCLCLHHRGPRGPCSPELDPLQGATRPLWN